MSHTAEIIVLIPHYNNPEGLKKSLVSIVEHIPLAVLIVDDGSRERPLDEDYIKKDLQPFLQLEFINLEQNSGIEAALNTGLKYIQTKDFKYIARLDCGDLCAPNRFAIQKELMAARPELGLVGSFVTFIDTAGKRLYDLKHPVLFEEIKLKMHVNAMFTHPTVMFSRDVIDNVGFYPTTYPAAEDFAYFFAIMKQYKAVNIPQFLVFCEINAEGISLQRRKDQLKSRMKILKEEFYWGFYPCYGLVRNFIISKLPYTVIYTIKRMLR